MRIYQHFNQAKQDKSIQRVAIGFFDGLHLGHAEVILGADTSLVPRTCVITFQQHPFSVLFPQKAPLLITSLEHKFYLLKKWDVGTVLNLQFDDAQSKQSAPDFLNQLKENFPSLTHISVGPNFRFGYKRLGTLEHLQAWCTRENVALKVPQPVTIGGEIISSSRIRQALQQDDLQGAKSLLGHPYSLFGTVITGEKLGRTLGWPTANLNTHVTPICSTGVYAGLAILENGQAYKAAINIGHRPTVSRDRDIHTEAHLLEFNETIYDQNLEIELHHKIRDEVKFDSLEALKKQVEQDIAKVRGLETLNIK
ncbi:MAG: bifunctional riboflavin kinase/FAD synthetase [Verrucomicrobiota bacterium]